MTHKLFVEVAISFEKKNEKYQPLLSDFETVRGVETKFRFRIKNIGKTIFPGGKLEDGYIIFSYNIGLSTIEASVSPLKPSSIEIPRLKVGQAHTIQTVFSSPISGPHFVKIKIKSIDKSKIEYYQKEEGAPLEDEWFAVMNNIEREKLEQILLLQKLVKGK